MAVLRLTHDTAEGNLERSGEVGVEVEDAASQRGAAVGYIDVEAEVDAAGLDLGVAGRVHIEVEFSDHPVKRVAFVTIHNDCGFDLAVARTVGVGVQFKSAGGDDEVDPIAGDGSFEIGVVSGWLGGQVALSGWAVIRCTLSAMGIESYWACPGP